MNNIEKKLDALIDALGFDVETDVDYQERRISKTFARTVNSSIYGRENGLTLMCVKGEGGLLDIDENDMYLARLTKPIVNYKLSARGQFNEAKAMVPMTVNSEAWAAIVEYMGDHRRDIEEGINDFDTLRPVWKFFVGIS